MKKEHYVLGFMYNEARNHVLLQKASASFMEGRWNGIGGHIEEDDECPRRAMQREANEEADINIHADWRHKITMICPGGTIFIFSLVVNAPIRLWYVQENAQELSVFPLTVLPSHRMANITWMIPLCLEDFSSPVMITTNSLGIKR